MNKIKLTQQQKVILKEIIDGEEFNDRWDIGDINSLEFEGLIDIISTKDGDFCELSDFGRAYIKNNPSLENPSLFDDKKFLINSLFSFVAIVISCISLIISCKKQ